MIGSPDPDVDRYRRVCSDKWECQLYLFTPKLASALGEGPCRANKTQELAEDLRLL